jgi:hypothetical protein
MSRQWVVRAESRSNVEADCTSLRKTTEMVIIAGEGTFIYPVGQRRQASLNVHSLLCDCVIKSGHRLLACSTSIYQLVLQTETSIYLDTTSWETCRALTPVTVPSTFDSRMQ